ncbi:MAG: DnaB-like helicase C-terminal domain-containing protein, partial [Firmicutes bacterium]|nr:DnaB-like helicase C-terminal domain-containing protein [Bacillota bacterium]
YCAVFSLEMPADQLARRMLCSVAKVSMTRASKGDLTNEEWARINKNRAILDKAQIYIDDTSAITPAEIISKCRKLKREKKLDLVMIDYLQLMALGKKVENRQQEISEITRSLKIAAKELKVPIILLSQLSRKVEERKDKQPLLSDLRESGAIEQDADIVMFIYKPSEAESAKAAEPGDIFKLIISKHRNGETGIINVRWRGEYVSFENYADSPKISSASAPVRLPPSAPKVDKFKALDNAVNRVEDSGDEGYGEDVVSLT